MSQGLASGACGAGWRPLRLSPSLASGMSGAQAAPGGSKGKPDTRSVGSDYNNGKPLPLSKRGATEATKGKDSDSFKVGATRTWLGYDDVNGTVYLKSYVLRGVGPQRGGLGRQGPRLPGR